MPKIDYSKTVIYQAKCRDPSVTYLHVNHSTDIKKRNFYYKRDCENQKTGDLYSIVNSTGGWDNWYIIVLETYNECKSKQDAVHRTAEWYTKLQIVENRIGNVSEILTNDSIGPQNDSFFSQNDSICSQISPDIKSHTFNEEFSCNYCKKYFTLSKNLKRHINNYCKNRPIENKTEKTTQELEAFSFETMKTEMAQIIKQQIEQFMNTNCVVHPRTLNKLNNRMKMQLQMHNNSNSNNNTNNNTNNTNNTTNIQGNTINNQITIVELGKENLSNFFTQEQQMQILNRKYKCIDYLIETVHFNDKNKQFQNVAITNAHDAFAYKYVEREKKFIMVNKDNLLEEMMSYRIEDIREFFENQQGLNETTYNAVKRFLDDMDDNEKKLQQKTRDIKLIMYNKRDLLKLTL